MLAGDAAAGSWRWLLGVVIPVRLPVCPAKLITDAGSPVTLSPAVTQRNPAGTGQQRRGHKPERGWDAGTVEWIDGDEV